jgi:hypothetical protein
MNPGDPQHYLSYYRIAGEPESQSTALFVMFKDSRSLDMYSSRV